MAQSTSDGNNIPEIKVSSLTLPVGATKVIFSGKCVCTNTSTGQVEMASDSANLVFSGISLAHVDNTADATGGALGVPVQPKKELRYFRMSGTPLATWLEKILYFLDDQTVGLAAASTNKVVAGRCKLVESTGSGGTVIIDPTDVASYSTTT